MTLSTRHRYKSCFVALSLVGCFAIARSAQADVVLLEKDGWTVATDGRVNGFYSFETGDHIPTLPDGTKGTHALVGTPFGSNADDASDGSKFTTSRIHTGYVGSIFGFTVKKQISETLKVTGHVAIWWPIETDQFRGYSSMVPDPRESYVKLEGTWGGLLAGRALSLHDRGGTVTDFKYANGYSVGGVCNAVGQGPLCGNIGYGYQFPGFAAGIVYNTPNFSGFQVTVGAYDPVRIGSGGNELGRTPVPRFEGEANYDLDTPKFKLSLYVNGLSQQAGADIGPNPIVVHAYGVSYGARAELFGSMLKLGAGGNWDKGSGDMIGLVGTVPLSDEGELRTGDGYFGQAMVSVGDVDLAAGAGVTRIQELAADILNNRSVIKTRVGMNAGVNYHLGPAVLNAQFFRAQHTYWLGEKQTMTFLHAGMTFVW